MSESPECLVERLRHMADNHHAIKDCDAMSKAADLIERLSSIEASGLVEALNDAARCMEIVNETLSEMGGGVSEQLAAKIQKARAALRKAMTDKETGAPFGNRLSSSTGPASGSGPSGFDPARDGEIVAWLRRRVAMCREHMPPWYRPLKRQHVRVMAGAFNALALLIEQGVHRAETLNEETEAMHRALRVLRDRDGAEGGDANAAPVPQDRQARAEGIAHNPIGKTPKEAP